MKQAPLLTRDYRTITYVSGPLIFVSNVKGASFGEIVRIFLKDGEERTGEVLDISEDIAVIQVFEGTRGIDTQVTKVRFTGEPARINVSIDMLGRVFSGVGKARDGGPEIIPDAILDIAGTPINPSARDKPGRFHPDRYVHYRRVEHARTRPETAHLLRLGVAGKQARCPDCPTGKSSW